MSYTGQDENKIYFIAAANGFDRQRMLCATDGSSSGFFFLDSLSRSTYDPVFTDYKFVVGADQIFYSKMNTSSECALWSLKKDDLQIITETKPGSDALPEFYPNPSAGTIRINHHEDLFTVLVFDMMGQQVARIENQNEFNLSLPSGIYILNYQSDHKRVNKKVILHR